VPSIPRAPSFVTLVRFLKLLMKLTIRNAGFVRTKRIDYLAGVLLAVTGSEAMYAKYVGRIRDSLVLFLIAFP